MKISKIKDLKKGTFFVMKNAKIDVNDWVDESAVWIRGDYDRSSKTYSCHKFVGLCFETFLKGSTDVIIDFNFKSIKSILYVY